MTVAEHVRRATQTTRAVRLLVLSLISEDLAEDSLAFAVRRLCDAIEALAAAVLERAPGPGTSE